MIGEEAKQDAAMEERFGRFVDGCLARRVLSIDAESRVRLLEQVAIALNKAAMRLAGNAVGNYGPDEDAARVPAWKGAPPRDATWEGHWGRHDGGLPRRLVDRGKGPQPKREHL